MSAKTRTKAPIVLASTSRYRRELLARLGHPFEVVPPDVDESPLPGERPADTASRLALAKARAVAGRYRDALVIGADQVADVDGIAVSKPGNHADALTQLRRLSGRMIVFHTAIAVVDAASGRAGSRIVDVRSTFRALGDEAIERYLQRERPYDCAGAVKSESLGIALFESIESTDPTALIGLPLIALVDLLREAGFDVLGD
jgi:septum formation protein